MDQAIQILVKLGSNTFMAKTDIKSAFRIVPVNPHDYHLLGFKWNEQFYYDRMLPMGLSIGCQIFETLSTSIQWMSQTKLGINHMLHILDDFLIIEKTERNCKRQLQQFKMLCSELHVGVPLSPEKNQKDH